MEWGHYILRRFLHLLPTLGLLFLVVFLLQQSMPGDPVEDLIRSADFESLAGQYEKRQAYNRIAKDMGVNDAVFYFSLGSRNKLLSKSTGDVRFDGVKNQFLKLHDRSLVDKYYSTLSQVLTSISSLDRNRVEKDRLYGLLFTVGQTPQGRSVIHWKELEELWPEPNVIEKLSVSRQEAIASSLSFIGSLPHMKWNGTNNRFHHGMMKLLVFEWGKSKIDGRRVMDKVGEAMIWTLVVTLLALFLSLLCSIGLSLWAAIHQGSFIEQSISAGLFALYAMPLFWFATIMIIFFTSPDYGSWTNIFPSVGIFVIDESSTLAGLWDKKELLTLPVFCLAIPSTAYFYRFIFTGQINERKRPYFTTARAKGLSEQEALLRHSFKNAVYPIIGLVAVLLPGLISGALIIEVIFNLPGMGRLMFQSIQTQDWNVVTAVVFISAILTFIGFILADLLLPIFDPKVEIDA